MSDNVIKRNETEQYVLSVERAGALLGISRPSAYKAVKKGEIPVLRIGSRLLVPITALEKMLENPRDNT